MPGRIGPFQIEAELGRGGHGVVYRARDERLDRLVAIKAIAAGIASDDAKMARFRDEARIIAQLNHPHIAQIHQMLEEDGRTYLVLEHVAGQSLADVIKGGRANAETILRLMAQVADALDSAHAHGIIHRDLKPDNILVTHDDAAKVLDFGIACVATVAVDTEAPTIVGTPVGEPGMLGTPGYMSPEQCRGETADVRADIFSFGCVLYECLCGQPAIGGHTVADRIASTLTADPDFGRLPAGLPDGVGALVRSCLARRVDDRLGAIHDARVVLREAAGEGQGGRPTPQAEQPAETPTRNNLPRQLDHFVGRRDEVTQLIQVLDDRSMATLVGPGGCGKTRLAIEVARRVLQRFEGGVWVAELATSDAARVPSVVAAALGIQDEPGKSVAEHIAASIGASPVLLVLDNCEHVRHEVRDLASALLDRCPQLRVLATSREPLGAPGELAWQVPSLGVPGKSSVAGPLTTPPSSASVTPPTATPSRTPTGGWVMDDLLACESVVLFIDRAREVRPSFTLNEANAGPIASICRRLDGIPLAIELAAARIGVLSAEQIEQHLDDRFRLLRATSGRPKRHQTLRAAIDWSYQMLDDRARHVLQRLAVFKEGCSLEGACAVLGPDADTFETLDVLTILSDKSLLNTEHTDSAVRYRLLETVREYAIEMLEDHGELPDAQAKRTTYYAQLAAGAREGLVGPEQVAWLERLEACGEDLLDAIDQAAAQDPGAAQQICAGVWRFWWIRGRMRVGLIACQRACDADHSPTASRGDALYAAGALAWALGELDTAWTRQHESLAIQKQLGNHKGVASSLNSLGLIAKDRGDLAAADQMFAHSLAIKREQGDVRGIAMSLNNLGVTARLADRLVEAKAHYAESAELLRTLGDQRAMARSLMNMAEVALKSNDLLAAHQGFDEARSCFEATGDHQGIALAGINLSAVIQAEGRPADAGPPVAEAVTLFTEIGDRRGLADAIEQVIGLAVALEAFETAARLSGAMTSLRAQWEIPRDASHHGVDAQVTGARESLSDDARAMWDRHEREGASMDIDRVTEAALAWLAENAPAAS